MESGLRRFLSFSRISRFSLIAALAMGLALLVSPPKTAAQGGDCTVSGTVLDSSGAVVPAANVSLVNQGNGETRSSQTNGSGFFSFTAVPPGTYRVQVTHAGFNAFSKKDIVLHPGNIYQVANVALKPGSTTTTVEVAANAADVIPVDTGEKTITISAKEVQNLAIVGRNAVELLKIIPGVVNSGGYSGEVAAFNQGVGSYEVNGTRNDALAIVNDGADTVDPGCNCGSSVTPNVDMISEVQVQTSNFSAENGKGPVVIQTVDKSGASQFHGEAYYSIRTYKLNANDWQNNANSVTEPKNKFQYPGFNIGGPVLIPGTSFNRHRDKLFFFAGFEWMRQGVDLGLKRTVVPTDQMRKGDFSGVIDPNSYSTKNGQQSSFPRSTIFAKAGSNVSGAPCVPKWDPGQPDHGTVNSSNCLAPYVLNPAAMDPGGIILDNLEPAPNIDPSKAQGNNYVNDTINPQNRQQSLVRVDYNFTQNTKLYARYNHETESEPYPFGLWWAPSQVPYPSNIVGQNHSNSISASLTNVLSPTLTNEMTVAITRLDLPNVLTDPNKVSRKALGYPYRGVYAPGEDVVPSTTGWGNGFAGVYNAGGFTPTLFANKWTNTFSDNLSKVSGTHLMKFGVYYEHLTNDQPTNNQDQGQAEIASWGGPENNAYANLLLGYMNSFSQSTANIVGNMAENELDAYGQDSWHVTPRLTLDYGVRVFHMGFMYDTHGHIGVFEPALYDPNAPISAYSGLRDAAVDPSIPLSGFHTPAARVAPHFGWAWDVTGQGSTVIRGGFGTYYYRDQGNVFFGAIGNPPQEANSSQCCSVQLKNMDLINPKAAKTGLNVLDLNDHHVPLTYSYSFTVSRRMPYSTVMEVSYVGNSSHNQVLPASGNGGFDSNWVPQGALFGLATLANTSSFSNLENSHRRFPTYAAINQASHVLTQHYDSLQVTASRQTGRVNYSLAYTFSKAMGVGGNFYGANGVDPFDTRGRSYGVLNYDQTNALSAAYNVLVPDFGTKFFGNNGVAHGVLNGWQISGISQWRSGFPLSAGINGNGLQNDIINGTPNVAVRPNFTCNPVANLKPQQIFNGACYQAPSPHNNGLFELPFYIRGPWYNNTDLSIFKNFPLGANENRKLQLRLEAFNFDNHPLWNFISGDPGLTIPLPSVADPATGKQESWGQNATPNPETGFTTNKTGHRIVQLAVKFYF